MSHRVDTGVENAAPTNGVGYYTFPQLNPGNYELTVRKTGFRAATRPPFKLDVGQIARVDLSLMIGNVDQSVTVNAEAPIVSSQKATVEQVIGSQIERSLFNSVEWTARRENIVQARYDTEYPKAAMQVFCFQ